MTFDEQTRKLIPGVDMCLTQAVLENEDERRFSKLMYLGVNDSPSNYVEWNDSQKEQWEKDHPQPEDEQAE